MINFVRAGFGNPKPCNVSVKWSLRAGFGIGIAGLGNKALFVNLSVKW